MSAARRWFDAMGGAGPDWVLRVGATGASLRAVVRGLALVDLRRVEPAARDDEDLYVDPTTHAALVARRASPPSAWTNLYLYDQVTVRDDALCIERGYGGRGDGADDDRVLAALLAAPGVVLAAWSVAGGGEGYAPVVVRSGDGAESLRRALSGT